MTYNILNGDSLATGFSDTGIEGEIIVVREALIDGDLGGDNLEEFWHTRAKYIDIPYDEYFNKVGKEFEKIVEAPDGSVFNLWFEYDLFCQVNMWFLLSIINNLSIKKKVFAVYTAHLDRNSRQFWNGFGPAQTKELLFCWQHKIALSVDDQALGNKLWQAYKNSDLVELGKLAKNQSPAFPYLQEVIAAHIDRFPVNGMKGRPEKVLEEITTNITTDFHAVFTEFWRRESIYGFGDTQLKRLYDKVMG